MQSLFLALAASGAVALSINPSQVPPQVHAPTVSCPLLCQTQRAPIVADLQVRRPSASVAGTGTTHLSAAFQSCNYQCVHLAQRGLASEEQGEEESAEVPRTVAVSAQRATLETCTHGAQSVSGHVSHQHAVQDVIPGLRPNRQVDKAP
ncbi:hypothetical protein JB92DRAFT_3125073 [Gautieria morchelliformis]|nr:hypothetical protein JB92DRAFT_3125073 [Gautieria morchelliformis]